MKTRVSKQQDEYKKKRMGKNPHKLYHFAIVACLYRSQIPNYKVFLEREVR